MRWRRCHARRVLAAMDWLEDLLPHVAAHGRWQCLARVGSADRRYPIYGITLGDAPPGSPVLVVVGGVHGLERIGTEVVLAVLTTWLRRLEWDDLSRDALRRARLAFLPLVNPIGMALAQRANGNGIDLMRNAPVEADVATPLVGG